MLSLTAAYKNMERLQNFPLQIFKSADLLTSSHRAVRDLGVYMTSGYGCSTEVSLTGLNSVAMVTHGSGRTYTCYYL